MNNRPVFARFNKIAPLIIHKYERYLPTAFDESMSMLQKVNKIIQFLNEMGLLIDELIEQWNEMMEWLLNDGLTEAVENMLDKWLEEGVFEDIINQKIFGELNARLNFNIKREPTYLNTFRLVRNSVMQHFFIHDDCIYISQVGGSPEYNSDESESYYINRFTLEGAYLDHMILNHGGHGSNISPEIVDGQLYIWSSYDIINEARQSIGTDLVRFRYSAGAELTETSPFLERYNKFTNDYVLPSIDQDNDLIALRILSGDTSVVQLRKLSEFKSGVNKVIARVDIPKHLNYLQGFAINDKTLYWYTGDTNSVNHDWLLSVFDFDTGEMKQQETLYFGDNAFNQFDGGQYEPEGLFFYRQPVTGEQSLFVGVATGTMASGLRPAKVYAYHSLLNEAKFSSHSNHNSQKYKITEADGRALDVPTEYTKLSDVRKTGKYYLTTSQTNKYSDIPESIKGKSGVWFEVSSLSYDRGSVSQTLTRNTATTNPRKYERVIQNDNSIGEWKQFAQLPENEILWSGGLHMIGSETVTPSVPLSDCPSGWILVWSDADADGSTNDYNWFTTTIPKVMGTLSGNFFVDGFSNADDLAPLIASKILTITNTTIKGDNRNNLVENNSYDVALRYVIAF